MDTAKSIESLTWSDATYLLSEFLEKFGVPNLVCVNEGHYGTNEACTFESNQVLMLHTTRRKQNVVAEDAYGQPISIPLQCENKLLRCPSSICWRYDTINVSQMPCVYPEIRYFRVLENHWDEGLYYLEPESILEVEKIDSKNSTVKFKDIDQPLPSKCSVVFEPLLDYREYTLKRVVSLFGLPAKVRFVKTPKANIEVENDFENLVSNLGKVTLVHSAEPQLVVVATVMDGSNLPSDKTSVKCSQVPKDYSVNVSVPKGLLKNDPAYFKIVNELNQSFLDKCDLNELDSLEKCQYMDEPTGNTRKVLGSVLKPKVREQTVPKLLSRSRLDVKVPPPVSIKPLKGTRRTENEETVTQSQTHRDADENGKGEDYKDVKFPCQRYDEPIYESIDDSSSDDGYEEINDHMMSRSDESVKTNDYVDMSSKFHVTSQTCDVTNDVTDDVTDDHDGNTSDEDEYYTMCDSLLKNRRNDYENATVMSQHTKKNQIKMARRFEVSFGPRSKPNSNSTDKAMVEKPNNENLDESENSLKSDLETTENISIPTDVSRKEDDNDSPENIKPESTNKKPPPPPPPPKPRFRGMVTCKPTVPIPSDIIRVLPDRTTQVEKCVEPDWKTNAASSIPKDLSSLTVEGVGRLLASLNMACYVETFEKEQVDGEILMELDETTLNSLDLKPFHVRKLMKVIAGWRPNVESMQK